MSTRDEPHDWADELAHMIAYHRNGNAVYMDGSHVRPRTSEEKAAREFVERIRADEVTRRFGWVTQEDARAWFLADLRAKVEALPTTRITLGWLKGWDSVSLADVLALIGEGDS